MNDTLLIVAAVLVALASLFLIPQFMVKRAMGKVIAIFRRAGATSASGAKTAAELGLEPPSLMQRMLKARDYKPLALKTLVEANIVQATEDGKLYLVEERLANTKLRNA